MKNQKTMGNKGFSLVELIVVIAIMVVLVAVLAPVFTRYIERSRRATDVSNANAIAESVLADVASGDITTTGGNASGVVNHTNVPSIAETAVPTAQGSVGKGRNFFFTYTGSSNTCEVKICADGNTAAEALCPDLTIDTEAEKYTKADSSSWTTN